MKTFTGTSEAVPQSDPDLLVGIERIAQFLAVNPRHIGRLSKERGLPLAEIGHHKVSTRRALLAWVESQMMKGGVDGSAS